MLQKVTEQELIFKHAETILEKGLFFLCDNFQTESLGKMYKLLNQVQLIDKLKDRYKSYIVTKGKEIVNTNENVIDQLLKFKEKLEIYNKKSFCNDQKINFAVKQSWEEFINIDEQKVPTLLASYIDECLRKGSSKKYTDQEAEEVLENSMQIFRYILAKDIFEGFYIRKLSKRLLLKISTSNELERIMISKLKIECGSNFTHKFESMFNDIEISSDLMNQFKQNRVFEIDVQINVLTTGVWPAGVATKFNLPTQLQAIQREFEKFYEKIYTGRSLKWPGQLSTCILKMSLSGNIHKEISCSLFQCITLLLFNTNNKLTMSQIQDLLQIPLEDLKLTLYALSQSKVKILKKTPDVQKLLPSDIFQVNEEFNSKFFRISVNQVQIKETCEESEQTRDRVLHDRMYQIDACILRIMKSRKQLEHNELLNEVYNLIKIPLQQRDIKLRIESLIEREYLVRDQKAINIYNYVA